MNRDYDFSGWATRSNVRCSDGRIIMPDAFKDCDGTEVPLVWMHQHGGPENVLGHALLEYRPEGMYAYGSFNDTEEGSRAKHLVSHGDIRSLSIFANQLVQKGCDVLHGIIREVSLVYAGQILEHLLKIQCLCIRMKRILLLPLFIPAKNTIYICLTVMKKRRPKWEETKEKPCKKFTIR